MDSPDSRARLDLLSALLSIMASLLTPSLFNRIRQICGDLKMERKEVSGLKMTLMRGPVGDPDQRETGATGCSRARAWWHDARILPRRTCAGEGSTRATGRPGSRARPAILGGHNRVAGWPKRAFERLGLHRPAQVNGTQELVPAPKSHRHVADLVDGCYLTTLGFSGSRHGAERPRHPPTNMGARPRLRKRRPARLPAANPC